MTNADKIRAMTDDEMLDLFTKGYAGTRIFVCPARNKLCFDMYCEDCFRNWLKREVEE